MLYAGIYLNIGLLNFTCKLAGRYVHPATLAISAALFSLFLHCGVLYAPARFGATNDGGTLSDLSKICFGRWPTFVLKYGLYPAWLFSCVLFCCFAANACLSLGVLHSPVPGIILTLMWLAVVASSSRGTASELARSSILISVISAVAIVGVAISVRPHIVAPFNWQDTRGWMSPVEPFLLWGGPALLLIGHFAQGRRPTRGDLFGISLAGIWVPLVTGMTCAVLTVTGRAMMINGHTYDYFSYIFKPTALRQGKAILLAFTMLTASRFAFINLVQFLSPTRKLFRIWLVPGFIVLGSSLLTLVIPPWEAFNIYWAVTAVPFFPLAGVLSAAYIVTRRRPGGIHSIDRPSQRWLVTAWLVGCALAFSPKHFLVVLISPSIYAPPDGWRYYTHLSPFGIILGWIASFVITCVALLLRSGLSARPGPDTLERYDEGEVDYGSA